MVLDEGGKSEWPSLLGTGGNDGRLDFTNNFMLHIGALFDLTSESGKPKVNTRALLENCLWASNTNKLVRGAIGQYQPGNAGGANSSTVVGNGMRINGWDFVLMMEGTIILRSYATRRLGSDAPGNASAPFAVRPHAMGFASAGSEESQRGEQWMPLWKGPATLKEVATIFGEARVQLRRRTANEPVDVARAIGRLGVARGIDAFVRYGYWATVKCCG